MNVKRAAESSSEPESAPAGMLNPWVALVGRGSDGRAVATEALVDDLLAAGVRVGGLKHRRVTNDAGDRIGYDLVDRETGMTLPLCRLSETPDICDLEFDPAAFVRGRHWALEGLRGPTAAEVIVVEAGPVEARGGGHRQTIDALIAAPAGALLLLSVRPWSLSGLALELPDPAAWLELPCTEDQREAFALEIARRARAHRARSFSLSSPPL